MATSALSEIICFSLIMRCLFLFKKSRNIEAPMRLQPSTNGWSFIKCLLGRLIIPRAMRVDKRALALRDIV